MSRRKLEGYHRFSCQVYCGFVYFGHGMEFRELWKKVEKAEKLKDFEYPVEMERKAGGVIQLGHDKEDTYIIWLKDPKTLTILNHEVHHLALFILTNCGVKYDPNNSEPTAYYESYLFEQLVQLIIEDEAKLKKKGEKKRVSKKHAKQ